MKKSQNARPDVIPPVPGPARVRNFLSISTKAALAIFRESFPFCRIEELSPVTSGRSASVYRARIANPSRCLCLRLGSAHEITKIVKVLQLLEELAEAPRLILHRKNFLVTSWLSGANLDTVIKGLDASARSQIAFTAGQLLSRVHAVLLPRFGFVFDDGPGCSSAREFIQAELDFLLASPLFQNTVPDFLVKKLLLFLKKKAPLLKGKPRLVLQDFAAYNILVVRKKGLWQASGLYDFGDALAGLPEWDFLKLSRLFQTFPDMARPFFQGYGTAATGPLCLEDHLRIYEAFRLLLECNDVLKMKMGDERKRQRLREAGQSLSGLL